MKTIKLNASLLFACLFFFTSSKSQPANSKKNVINSSIVMLAGNGYFFPGMEEERNKNMINEQGATPWTSSRYFIKVFFYPQKTGNIEVALRLKSPGGKSKISIMLDSSGTVYELDVPKNKSSVQIPAGLFNINSTRYHCITIKGISKSGDYFPFIESLVISGPAAQGLKYNTTTHRGAPATHLTYGYPMDANVTCFYNEITVPVGENATNAYYMSNGFDGGYMGIQLNNSKERRVIFSIWSNYDTNDPKQIPAEYAVTLLKKGKGVYTDQFGNEGSGGHSHLNFNWKQGITYKLLVVAKASGDRTIYTGWFFAPENKQWMLISQWEKRKTEGKLLSGFYSFVENFGPNGSDHFKALYGNQWIGIDKKQWVELLDCELSTTADSVLHPRFDYGAGVEDNKFYMYTGGFEKMNNRKPGSVLSRKKEGKKPDIDSFILTSD